MLSNVSFRDVPPKFFRQIDDAVNRLRTISLIPYSSLGDGAHFATFFPCFLPFGRSICVGFCITDCMRDTFILFPINSDYFFPHPPACRPADRADRPPGAFLLH